MTGSFTRLRNEARRKNIIDAALKVIAKKGLANTHRQHIATEADTSPANITTVFGSMDALITEVIVAAVASQNLKVIAQAVATKHPKARNISRELKRKAMNAFI